MKNKLLAVVLMVSMLMSTTALFAQPNSVVTITKNKYALKNLVAGINSENVGVRKSAIYFAGKYRIAEAVDALIDRLNDESEASVRLLIAYTLFEISDEKGLDAIKSLSLNDKNDRVKSISKAIYKEYQNTQKIVTSF